MERRPPKPMTPFDNMVTPPYLYTLKLMLPYTPSSNQRFLAIYIKFLEFRYTMDYFHGFPERGAAKSSGKGFAPLGMFEDLKPYMAPEEKEMMDQMEMMMNMMEMVQSTQAADGSSGASGGFNPMDMMMGMMDPEQREMFQTYSNMFESDMAQAYNNSNENPKKEGEERYERMDEQSGHEEP